jgi:pullulanase/glycogen debranching enzyme
MLNGGDETKERRRLLFAFFVNNDMYCHQRAIEKLSWQLAAEKHVLR